MKIETRFEICDHIYVIYDHEGEVCVYDDYISEIGIDENKKLIYYTKACIDIEEDEIILFDDKVKLAMKIDEILEKYREKIS